MNKDSEKIRKSEELRLKSLKQKAEEYKSKKSVLTNSVNQNKKKVFSDSEDDNVIDLPKKTTNGFSNQQQQQKSKSFNLFDQESDNDEKLKVKKPSKKHSTDDEEDESEQNDSDDDDGVNLFENKLNLDENKANKLIYLKTKFSNDGRFKIDERFVDSDSDGEKKESDNEIEKEKESALRILEQITGKPIKKLHESEKMKKMAEIDSKKKLSKMVRYDPTKEEHKVFEINKEEEAKLAAKKASKKEDDQVNDEAPAATTSAPTEDPSHFYEIRDDIKNLFCKNEVFQFKFSNNHEKSSDEEEEEEVQDDSDDDKKFRNFSQMKRSLDYLNEHYESSLSSADDDDGDDYKNKSKVNNNSRLNDNIPKPAAIRSFPNDKNADFFPDINESKLQEALKFFVRPKDMDELREEWTKERENLVEDYKKKHKKARRVQRLKDEEKLFVWKKSAFEQKNFKKHKK